MTHIDTKLQTSPIAWFCIGEFFGVWNITLMYSVLNLNTCVHVSVYVWNHLFTSDELVVSIYICKICTRTCVYVYRFTSLFTYFLLFVCVLLQVLMTCAIKRGSQLSTYIYTHCSMLVFWLITSYFLSYKFFLSKYLLFFSSGKFKIQK